MFSKISITYVALAMLASSDLVMGRMRWMERDDKAILLHPRRFGQEHPAVIEKLSAACDGAVCGNLAGAAITPLLAAQGECTQQDMADKIIDAAQQFDDATKKTMIDLAIEYRQAEKNTPPDFSVQPNTNRNSVFCQKAPKNAELNGLVQAQDPANDPNVFFDPATKASVKLGDQPNTQPFGGAASAGSGSASASASASDSAASASASDSASASAATSSAAASASDAASEPCTAVVTVTVTGDASAATSAATSAAASATASASTGTGSGGNFGSCSTPSIDFGLGFDNRKETSFQPTDKTSYDHGSAQAIGIIAQFICDTLTNKCGADQAAKDTCKTAQAAVTGATAKTGGQADLFNAAFGLKTNFASVQAVDDQGRAVGGAASTTAAAAVATDSAAATSAASSASASATGSASGSGGNFGSCSTPSIDFGLGFDNRKETSFQPTDKTSYDHGSAQAIGIIAQFICDTLTNKCGADQAAKDTCKTAQAAVTGATAKTGGQADLFNAAFGLKTNFASVQAVDDQGRAVGVASGAASGAASATASAGAASASSSASSGGIGNFGSCSTPSIDFGLGFDNRKETSFQPTDKTSFDHGSAQAIGIIAQFICDTLTNKCGADQTAKDTCKTAQAAVTGATAKTGGQADLFNAAFGLKTNFASVQAVDDQGRAVGA